MKVLDNEIAAQKVEGLFLSAPSGPCGVGYCKGITRRRPEATRPHRPKSRLFQVYALIP
jgi:hypothetical protein